MRLPVDLTPDAEGAALARRVAALAVDVMRAPVDLAVAELLTSELIARVPHDRDAHNLLVVDVTPQTLRVEITETGGASIPQALQAEDSPWLVDGLASRWGRTPAPDGSVLWFELDAAH